MAALTGETIIPRTVLLTGANGVLGKEIARKLATIGYRLAITDLADPVALAGELGEAVIYHAGCNLESIEELDSFSSDLLARHKIDGLVNNAALQLQRPLEEFSPELMRQFNRINVEAPFQLAKAVSRGMIERKWGRIVNLVSGQSWRPYPGFLGYVTSKMGLVGLTRALAAELGAHGITVNGITPSATQTEANREVIPEWIWQSVREQQLIHRTAEPADLVGAIAFLLSEDARFMTGQTMFVDGGLVLP